MEMARALTTEPLASFRSRFSRGGDEAWGLLLRLACDLPTMGTVLETCVLFGSAGW